MSKKDGLVDMNQVGQFYYILDEAQQEKIDAGWMQGRLLLGDVALCIKDFGTGLYNYMLVHVGCNSLTPINASAFSAYAFAHPSGVAFTKEDRQLIVSGASLWDARYCKLFDEDQARVSREIAVQAERERVKWDMLYILRDLKEVAEQAVLDKSMTKLAEVGRKAAVYGYEVNITDDEKVVLKPLGTTDILAKNDKMPETTDSKKN